LGLRRRGPAVEKMLHIDVVESVDDLIKRRDITLFLSIYNDA
jgi:hypothetical protein